MYELLALLSLLLQATTWLLLLGFGAWLYRRLHLRSLPWLGAYAVLAMPLSLVMPQFLGAVVNRGALPGGWTTGEFLQVWAYGEMALRSLTGLLLAVMVVAEVAGLLARLSPGSEQRALRLLLVVRERPVLLGIALLGLTLAGPMVVAILWLAESAAGVAQVAIGWF